MGKDSATGLGVQMKTSFIATVVTLAAVLTGWHWFGWVGVFGGVALAAVLILVVIVLRAFPVLLDCLVNPLGMGREYTFRNPAERPSVEEDEV